jgi:hypothetical protein
MVIHFSLLNHSVSVPLSVQFDGRGKFISSSYRLPLAMGQVDNILNELDANALCLLSQLEIIIKVTH